MLLKLTRQMFPVLECTEVQVVMNGRERRICVYCLLVRKRQGGVWVFLGKPLVATGTFGGEGSSKLLLFAQGNLWSKPLLTACFFCFIFCSSYSKGLQCFIRNRNFEMALSRKNPLHFSFSPIRFPIIFDLSDLLGIKSLWKHAPLSDIPFWKRLSVFFFIF